MSNISEPILLISPQCFKYFFLFVSFLLHKAAASQFGSILSLLMTVTVVTANADSWLLFDCYEEGTLKPGKT